jgi:hypothetical protein
MAVLPTANSGIHGFLRAGVVGEGVGTGVGAGVVGAAAGAGDGTGLVRAVIGMAMQITEIIKIRSRQHESTRPSTMALPGSR